MQLSSQGKDVTQTSVEESSDDCKLKNTYYSFYIVFIDLYFLSGL